MTITKNVNSSLTNELTISNGNRISEEKIVSSRALATNPEDGTPTSGKGPLGLAFDFAAYQAMLMI